MRAVILAAGKSTRTYPLTLTRPKVLLEVMNKPILQHNLEALESLVDEVVIVVGYKKEMVMERFGERFGGIKISYIEQKEQLGTAHALLQAKEMLSGRFFVLMGDDIYKKELLEECAEHELCVMAKRVENPERFGVWVVREGKVSGFAEKPEKFVSDLANCGGYVLDEEIFEEIRNIEMSERMEYELNEAVNNLAKRRDVLVVDAKDRWMPVGYPWSVIDATEWLLRDLKESVIEGEVEEGATLKGPVVVGKGSVIKNGSYIEGPVFIGENCRIGPNCFIRAYTCIGNNCSVGNAVEVKNSVVMSGSKINHLSYIGDSVIGEGVNIGAGTITANLRHDGKEVHCIVKGKKVSTGRRKLGAIISDSVKTGIKTMFYPGRKVWPEKTTLPGEVVKRDIV